MHKPVRKAVFPVAGLGTRFLPATKAMPKEMLPIVDKPLIQYAVEEAKAAGIEEFFFVTSRGKSAIDDHFDRAFELEATLRERGKMDLLEELEAHLPEPGQISYTRQQTPLGLGHAVWCARSLVGDEPFAVLLADDLMVCEAPCLAQMVEAYEETGGNLVAVIEVPRAHTSRYGVLDVVSDRGLASAGAGRCREARPRRGALDLDDHRPLHHPARGVRPSVDAAPGSGGEIQLTDALGKLIDGGQAFHGFRFEGRRFDCGDKLGFLEATVALGLRDPELGPGLRKVLSSYL